MASWLCIREPNDALLVLPIKPCATHCFLICITNSTSSGNETQRSRPRSCCFCSAGTLLIGSLTSFSLSCSAPQVRSTETCISGMVCRLLLLAAVLLVFTPQWREHAQKMNAILTERAVWHHARLQVNPDRNARALAQKQARSAAGSAIR